LVVSSAFSQALSAASIASTVGYLAEGAAAREPAEKRFVKPMKEFTGSLEFTDGL